MSNIKKVFILALVVIVIGSFAKYYNESNHTRMALEVCGTKANIKHVDSKGFTCREMKKR